MDDEISHRVRSDLKGRGYEVTAATQYGFDFAIYPGTPSLTHSTHLVRIIQEGNDVTLLDLVLSGRVAHTVRKSVLFAIPTKDSVRYLEVGWWNAKI